MPYLPKKTNEKGHVEAPMPMKAAVQASLVAGQDRFSAKCQDQKFNLVIPSD
jgi:hypothetical protein